MIVHWEGMENKEEEETGREMCMDSEGGRKRKRKEEEMEPKNM